MKEKKANVECDIFAKRLKFLFENSGKTHLKLAEFIEQETGESVTRQAVGQWCNGNTSPNTRTIPIIAKFFNVSTDYLFGLFEQPTKDKDLAAVADFLGISSRSLEKSKELISLNIGNNSEDIKEIVAVIEKIIVSPVFFEILEMCSNINYESKKLYEDDGQLSYLVFATDNVANRLKIDYDVFTSFIEKRKRRVNKYDYEIDAKCDKYRYENIKSIEMISDLFDFRKKITTLSVKEICDILDIDEKTLNDLRSRKKGD